MLEKNCEICGAIFEAHRSNQKYCEECGKNPKKARKHYARAVLINRMNAGELHKSKVRHYTCEQCGKEFLSYNGAKYCSDACFRQHNVEAARCCNCRKPLIDFGIRVESVGGSHYCSDACKKDAQFKRAEEHGRLGTCLQCGKEFIKASENSKFCSKTCYETAVAGGWRPKRNRPEPELARKYTARCSNCGKSFSTFLRGITYCSAKCKKELDKKKQLAEDAKREQQQIKKRGLCFLCKTPYTDCERMSSHFKYSPKGAVFESGKIIKCPKFTK